MALWGFAAGAPLLLFFMLVALPRGRAALTGCLLAGLVIGLLWAGYLLDFPVLQEQEFSRRGHLMLSLGGLSAAWAIAGSLQALRLRLPAGTPAWVWPVLVLVTFAVTVFTLLRILGF